MALVLKVVLCQFAADDKESAIRAKYGKSYRHDLCNVLRRTNTGLETSLTFREAIQAAQHNVLP